MLTVMRIKWIEDQPLLQMLELVMLREKQRRDALLQVHSDSYKTAATTQGPHTLTLPAVCSKVAFPEMSWGMGKSMDHLQNHTDSDI